MKKLICVILSVSLLLLVCACGATPTQQKSVSNTQPAISHAPSSQPSSEQEFVQDARYYGTWEITGLEVFAFDEGNSTIDISESEIYFKLYGETIGPYKYTESYDAYYTYLEIKDEDMPVVLTLLNDDMIVMFLSKEESAGSEYSGTTPWGMEFDAEADIEHIFMKKNSSTTELPPYLDLDKVREFIEFSEFTDYIYYPDSQILHLFADCLGVFYAYEGGGIEYIESITLSSLNPDDYDSNDILTSNNFAITDND